MKVFSIMRHLRDRSKALRFPMALLYLLLGMAAAWHGPHDIHSKAPLTIQSEGSSHSSIDTDAFCALCSWQSLQQETASTVSAVAVVVPLVATPNLPVLDAPAPGFSLAHLARGPPSV